MAAARANVILRSTAVHATHTFGLSLRTLSGGLDMIDCITFVGNLSVSTLRGDSFPGPRGNPCLRGGFRGTSGCGVLL